MDILFQRISENLYLLAFFKLCIIVHLVDLFHIYEIVEFYQFLRCYNSQILSRKTTLFSLWREK